MRCSILYSRTLLWGASFFLSLCLINCSGEGEKTKEHTYSEVTFPIPPTTLVDPQARASYIVRELWVPYEAVDTASFASTPIREQFFVDYFAVGAIATQEAFEISGKELFTKATPVLSALVIEQAKQYLNHPNSPIYNQDLYVSLMDVAIDQGLLDEAEQIRFQDLRTLWQKNRVGQQAEDFSFLTPDGKVEHLHSFPTKEGSYLALMFYNPGCSGCASAIAYIEQSTLLQDAIKAGQLQLLAIYAGGDESVWRASLKELPNYATIGTDREQKILNESLYDLRAIPSFYLLDSDKKVILKDVNEVVIEHYLYSLQGS